MCKWGESLELTVIVPAHLSYTGKKRSKVVTIDKCIHPIVRALNHGGVPLSLHAVATERGLGALSLKVVKNYS